MIFSLNCKARGRISFVNSRYNSSERTLGVFKLGQSETDRGRSDPLTVWFRGCNQPRIAYHSMPWRGFAVIGRCHRLIVIVKGSKGSDAMNDILRGWKFEMTQSP